MLRNKILPVIAAFFALALHTTVAMADDMPIMQEGNITYITGGIGDDEKQVLEGMQRDYNFHVLSAYTTGEYTGDARIIISDMAGNELLNTDTGPLFYARLPLGKYTVQGTSGGESKTQTVIIRRGKIASITFRWDYTEGK